MGFHLFITENNIRDIIEQFLDRCESQEGNGTKKHPGLEILWSHLRPRQA